MQEIEVKILEIDSQAVVKTLLEKGFSHKQSGEYWATFWDDQEKGLSNSGRILRLRKECETNMLTFKRNISREGVKIMEEQQTEVADMKTAVHILEGLDYSIKSQTRKHRQVYRKGDIEVVIDDYKDELGHIPPFLEIEAPSEAAIHETMVLLNLKKDQALSWDTYGLVRHYGQVKKVDVDVTLPLRASILRDNWKLEDCLVPDDADPRAIHLALDFGENPVGVASLYPKPWEDQGANGWRLRQMGVLPDLQGKGVGRKIMERAFDILREQEVPYLWCDAREVAFSFYESLGFAYISDYYDVPKVGPHRRMLKRIS
ncbi:MAG: class IV adenylate cyclase [Bacteroidia bacterium]